MNQYQRHPIDIALEALTPVLMPSFFLRSVRDKETKPKYPLVDYVIISNDRKAYDKAKNQWRSSYLVQVDFLIKESNPLDWCQYDELKDAQDRHALHYRFERLFEKFIELLTNPTASSKYISNQMDLVYGKLDFRFENFIGGAYLNKYGTDFVTGYSSQFVLSCVSDNADTCCFFDEELKLESLLPLTFIGSVSNKRITNALNP